MAPLGKGKNINNHRLSVTSSGTSLRHVKTVVQCEPTDVTVWSHKKQKIWRYAPEKEQSVRVPFGGLESEKSKQ